ncbi:uncharacterized protein FIBRA_02852 [Fibroporia radiculosa]|uniref:Uncharacterized protein n=1 Tax=Fibroporia radiculosa TaxID=599839 RepID=J4GN57_9APHY|nr:uncharacterized protein FIBRA_02852 [Fibroporia radiculosa]CCM00810.1 predicted protein [Fibroporia radiculosa]
MLFMCSTAEMAVCMPSVRPFFTQVGHNAQIFPLLPTVIQNRAFQQVTPNTTEALEPWTAIGDAQLTVIADTVPVSSALPNSLQVVIPGDASGTVGFANPGYWGEHPRRFIIVTSVLHSNIDTLTPLLPAGIKVDPSWTYDASLYYRFPSVSSSALTLTLGLLSSANSVLASNSITISPSSDWAQIALTLTPSATPANNNNTFFVTFDGEQAAGETVHFALLSLFPPTWKGQANGMRADIAETLADMKPAFFRFPGGNNLEASLQALTDRCTI